MERAIAWVVAVALSFAAIRIFDLGFLLGVAVAVAIGSAVGVAWALLERRRT